MDNDLNKYWQELIDDVLSSQTIERRTSDNNRIKNICHILQSLSTGKKTMDWAKDNNIQVLMDYQCENIGGYHILGSNAVCMNAHLEDIRLVPIIAHELRHSWQDKNNLIPGLYDSVEKYMQQIRFIEADATAYTIQICHEMLQAGINLPLNTYQKNALNMWGQNPDIPDYLQGKENLWAGFCVWFGDSNIRNNYDSGSILVAEKIQKISTVFTDAEKKEFDATSDYQVPEIKGLDVIEYDNFIKLGEMFGGGNYLKNIPLDILRHKEFTGNVSAKNQERINHLQTNGIKIEKSLRIPTKL